MAGNLALTVFTDGSAHEQNKFPQFPKFEARHSWKLADVPVKRYGDLTVEMKWGEMPAAAGLEFEAAQPGLLVSKVCFIAAAPLGLPPKGQAAFWDWPQWPRLMEAVVKDTMGLPADNLAAPALAPADALLTGADLQPE